MFGVHQSLLHAHPVHRDVNSLVDSLVQLGLDLPEVFGDAYLGRAFGVAVSEIDWDPVEECDVAWIPDAVVRLVSRRFPQQHRLGRSSQAAALREGELPPGVTRELHGDLAVIRWVQDVSDVEAVRSALDLQLEWLAR